MPIIGENAPFWQGDLIFTYTIRDAAGNTSQGSVTIPAPDGAPTALDDSGTVVQGNTIAIDVLANDTDPEGGPLTIEAATALSGSVSVNADNTLAYTAPADFTGTDTVTYTISDPAGQTAEGQVVISVAPVPNEPPLAGDDTAATVSGATVAIDVLANDTDPEGGALSITAASALSGSVSVNADNTLAYTAPADFTGTDTVTYTVSDPAGNRSEGSVSVTVDAPVILAFDTTTTLGDFSVEAAEGEIVLTIMDPADYAGTFPIATADLLDGPLNLVSPRISGSLAVGETLVGNPGLWAGDEADGGIDFAYQWHAGTEPIAGATADSHTVRSSDILSGLELSVQARNAAGTRSASARSDIAAWSPGADAAVVAWYDFSDASTITLDGSGKIEAIADKSGKGHTASQGDGGLRPASSAINGLQAADFSAGAVLPVVAGWQPGSGNSVVVAVLGTSVPTAEGYLLRVSSSGTNVHALRHVFGANKVGGAGYTHDNNGDTQWTPLATASTPALIGGQRDGASITAWWNGTGSANRSAQGAGPADAWLIGAASDAGGFPISVPVGEIIIALNASDVASTRQKIEGYLAHKWGVADRLPTTHPYKSAPPTV